MTLHGYTRTVTVVGLLLLTNSFASLCAGQAKDNWIRSSGKDLQICIRGEVFESDGRAATDPKISAGLYTGNSNRPLDATVDGHRFQVWIPVNHPMNQTRRYALWLKTASADGDCVAYKTLWDFELRQAAIDRIKLTLQSPTRHVEVKVTDEGRPVAGALVKADLDQQGIELRSRADAQGIARLGLLPQQTLSGLTAWTEDFRVGGFTFSRKPTRDSAADQHVVQLSRCRDQTLRFIDADGSPVPGIDFVLHIASPNYNFMGTNEHSRMTTDASGEVTHRWFPDWDKHHFEVTLNTAGWVIERDNETIDGTVVFKLKRSKGRKRVHGRVVSKNGPVGGFYVWLHSFQGERERYGDALSAFTDDDGRFSVDVLPDVTYCAYVHDSRWVSEIVDLIPYQSVEDRVTALELSIHQGEEVEVLVTSGPQKKPYPNLSISLARMHPFTWQKDGRTQHGTGGQYWSVTTDDSGRATTHALPGKLRASVYTPLWRTTQTVDVRSGEATTIRLHREVEEKRTVTGRLVLAEGLESKLKDAEIRIGSVDGNFDDQQTLTSAEDGRFSFETAATAVGVFGSTEDGQVAGSMVVNDLESPIELLLRPTIDYHGQLLGQGDRPLIGHAVRAIVRVEGNEDHNGAGLHLVGARGFEAKRIQSKTDEQGNFSLRGVPSEMKVLIQTDPIDESGRPVSLAEVYLEPNESRPRAVSRLAKTSTSVSVTPLAERYERALRDCRLSRFHMMLITRSDAQSVADFVNQNFMNYETNRDIPTFMQLVVSQGKDDLDSVNMEFLKQQNRQFPAEGHVLAYAIDTQGAELGRLDIDVTNQGAVKEAADFIHQHAPPRVDAEKKWREAFAEAKRSNRRVWARVGGRYCGPCFRLARWLDDHHETLNKDYVMLKIDNVRDQNGTRVAERLTRGKSYGIPFHAIFDQDEVILIDSASPLGNIGHPSGFDGKKHLRNMLTKTRHNLTDAEIDQLVESLGD